MSLHPVPSVGRRPLTLSEADFQAFRDFLYDRSGLYFGDAKKFLLESRVQKRMTALGLESPGEYRAALASKPEGPRELLELLDAVTTHETSFFRNLPQIDAFRRVVLPAVLQARRDSDCRSLQVWSAACSSGEEAYTLAMVALEVLGAEAARWRVRVLGTDIARSVLEKAAAAVYHPYSLRSIPAYYLQKYFDPLGGDAFRVKQAARALVSFQLLNFADESRMRQMGGFHVVFCRNALIYFDRQAKQRFVAHFARALESGGYLFVGHSESLHGISDVFKLIHLPGSLAYQKPEDGPAPQAERRTQPWSPTA